MVKQLSMAALVTARRILPMREVLARPWIAVCVPLALSLSYEISLHPFGLIFFLTDGQSRGKRWHGLREEGPAPDRRFALLQTTYCIFFKNQSSGTS